MNRHSCFTCTMLLILALLALPLTSARAEDGLQPKVDEATASELFSLAAELIDARGKLEARIGELLAAESIEQEAAAELLSMLGSIDDSIRPQINTLLGQPDGMRLLISGGETNANYDSKYRESTRSSLNYDAQYQGSGSTGPSGPATLPPGSGPPTPDTGLSPLDFEGQDNGSHPVLKSLSLQILEDGSSELSFEGFTAEEVGRLLDALSAEESTDADSGESALPEEDADGITGSDETDSVGLSDMSPVDRVKGSAGVLLQDGLAEREIASGLSAGIDLQKQRLHGTLTGGGPLNLRYSLAADGTAELEIQAEDLDPAALGAQASSVSRSAAQRLESLAAKLEKALRKLFD